MNKIALLIVSLLSLSVHANTINDTTVKSENPKLPMTLIMDKWKMYGDSKDKLILEGVINSPEQLKTCELVAYMNYNEKAESWTADDNNIHLLCVGMNMKKVHGYFYDSATPTVINITPKTKKALNFNLQKIETIANK